MKRAAVWAIGLIAVAVVMTSPVTTRQAINFQMSEITIPLYAKAAHFLSRSLSFRQLAREIARGSQTDQERAEAILAWMAQRIHSGVPQGLPVVDDHVLNVAIRGYGTHDQLADLFTILCAYLRIPSIRMMLVAPADDARHYLAVCAVKLDGQWRFVDPYHRIVPHHPDGSWMTIDAVMADPTRVAQQAGDVMFKGQPYLTYLEDLTPVSDQTFLRSWRQVPSKRVWYELRRLWQRVRPTRQSSQQTAGDR